MINFPIGTNGNLLFISVPILKHITVYVKHIYLCSNAATARFLCLIILYLAIFRGGLSILNPICFNLENVTGVIYVI